MDLEWAKPAPAGDCSPFGLSPELFLLRESSKQAGAVEKRPPGSEALSCHHWEGRPDNNGDIMRAGDRPFLFKVEDGENLQGPITTGSQQPLIEKPLPQGPPGGVIGILGGVVAIGLIIGVAVTVFMVHRRQQKTRTETDNDLTDLPPAHKPAPPPPKKKNSDMKGHLTSDDIQVVHLDKEEEMQKLPLQPPYYDMAPSESTHFTDKPSSVFLTLSHNFGCLTPHTPFASLVSRTLATRTVMSSMRSWILQLWPPLPAHEALLTLALGILSSMQPSSLAHTSACHYRPFPSDFGLK
ncbi:hypothetical protein L3Q82_018609, partial [Scortum barcoo]